MVHATPPFQDAFTHQTWISYLKENRRYAPKFMIILETSQRTEVKVTLSQGRHTSLYHHKMHLHNEIAIPLSYAPDRIILKTRSKVKFRVTGKWYKTLRHPNMHSHTLFGIPT